MTTAEKTLKWWNDYLEQNKTYPLIAEIEMQLKLAVNNEKQVKNIEVIPCCKSDSEQLVCDHEWIHNTHSDTKYCRKGCDGFKIHEAN